ncbi:hypothetical protein [Proteus vulgaris]|uniref:hypothetical protein n=1 Tax=Proteus vulgaris TaxID=585 RepID=UPI000667F767|nr:hypothetical protein C3940_07765 [Proteus mirabilis]SDC89381.1 hypothetical protein SAMN05216484_11054 [Proteus mirabilis]HAU5532538.1 hypothetical protein [Proteus mirabilis]HAU5554468.1 hypothetical protein [Proteus mirabilis]HAU5570560.1 hypothetical protein [Proteus mirabilis]
MPVPKYRYTEIGLTGRFRVRRQAITGLSIMQVETELRHSRYPVQIPEPDCRVTTRWRDATYEEAIRIQIDYGG